uniref:Acetyltransferase n=1 Tax=Klebsiella phage Hope TaxID=3350564 RepID=A0AB74UJM4_9CAUD
MKLKHISKTSDYTLKVLHKSDDITDAVKQLHELGHGIGRGLTTEQHYWRVLKSVLGKQYILGVYDSQGDLVGAVSYYPEAVEDCHYVEPVLYTDFFVLKPGNSEAMLVVMKGLQAIAKCMRAGRIAISRNTSDNTYKTTYHLVRSA